MYVSKCQSANYTNFNQQLKCSILTLNVVPHSIHVYVPCDREYAREMEMST
jgi:hypothetical protein